MITFLHKLINVSLHDQKRKVSIENLYWIVKHTIFDQISFNIWLNILGVNFSLALNEQLSILLLNYGGTLISGVRLHACFFSVDNLNRFIFITRFILPILLYKFTTFIVVNSTKFGFSTLLMLYKARNTAVV